MQTNRDEKGRFLPGHKLAGPGRPALAADLPFLEGVRATASAEKVAQVVEKLHALALAGNVQACLAYLSYTVGKPKESVDLTVSLRSLTDEQLRALSAHSG